MVTIRTITTMAAIKKLVQLDVYNAFLQGDFHEEVYMELSQGLGSKGEHLVCRLLKFFYGLKQAFTQWNYKLIIALDSNGVCAKRARFINKWK